MRINIETIKGMFQISVWDGGDKLANGGGPTAREAATWLVRAINHRAAKAEQLIIDAGMLTPDEVDAIHEEEERST